MAVLATVMHLRSDTDLSLCELKSWPWSSL